MIYANIDVTKNKHNSFFVFITLKTFRKQLQSDRVYSH